MATRVCGLLLVKKTFPLNPLIRTQNNIALAIGIHLQKELKCTGSIKKWPPWVCHVSIISHYKKVRTFQKPVVRIEIWQNKSLFKSTKRG